MKGWWRAALAVLAAIAIWFVALLYGVGYFGGPIFFDIPARAAPSPRHADVAVVVFSGNMGFHIGEAVAVSNALAARGLPVVGVNSLTYFNRARTPAEATALVEAAMDRALRVSRRPKVALVGLSFGADILHVALAGLPPAYREKVRNVVLVVPGAILQLQASPLEVFPIQAPDLDGTVTARRLGWAPTICIWGIKEQDSLCPKLAGTRIRLEPLPGGHMLQRDDEGIAAHIAAAIDASAVNAAATPPGSTASRSGPPAG